MMTFSRKFSLLVVLNSLLLLLIAGGLFFAPARKQDRSERRTLVSDKVEIMSITIDGSASVKLDKNVSSWILQRGSQRLPADSRKISAFLEAIKAVGRMELVAGNRDAWKDFGLEGQESSRIRLGDAEKKIIADFTVGRNSSASSDVYVAFPGSENAYRASSAFASYLEGGEAAWLDLKLLPALDPKSIESIEFRGVLAFDEKTIVTTNYSLVRDYEGWKTLGSGALSLDSVKIETMLRSLVSAKGEDFALPDTPIGSIAATMSFNLGNGEKALLSVGALGADKRFPVKTADSERLFYVASWALREAFKPLSELAKQN